MKTPYLPFLFALLVHGASLAHSFTVGELRIGHPAAKPTRPGQSSGAAYLSIENKGKQNDRLVAVSSPVAQSAEIHTMSMEGNLMKMREVGHIDIAAGTKLKMRPGEGYHLMLLGLKKPLAVGEKFPLTLNFEKAGKVEVVVFVEDRQTENSTSSAPHSH